MSRLAGKVALITGAANGVAGELMGFGGAAAWHFAAEGARVVLTDIVDEPGLKSADQIRKAGGDAVYIHLNVTQEADWQTAVTSLMERHGRWDTLVNSAGGARNANPLTADASLDDWRYGIDLNATGTFLGARAALDPMMRSGGGSIINISSIYGIVGGPTSPAYLAGKGAIRALTKGLAVQLADRAIRVNSVHPGFAMTAMTAAHFNRPEEAAPRLARVPMNRFATPEDVVHALIYLASDESSWMTGSELVIDGGLTAA